MQPNIIEVVRKSDSEAYIGRSPRDAQLLQFYVQQPYFFRSEYEHVLVALGQHGMSLLVDEPFDEEPQTGAKPANIDPGDLWLR